MRLYKYANLYGIHRDLWKYGNLLLRWMSIIWFSKYLFEYVGTLRLWMEFVLDTLHPFYSNVYRKSKKIFSSSMWHLYIAWMHSSLWLDDDCDMCMLCCFSDEFHDHYWFTYVHVSLAHLICSIWCACSM